MEHYGIENKGPFYHEMLSTLPTWDNAYIGRQVYVEDVGKYYVGTTSGWMVSSGGSASTDITQTSHGFSVGNILRYNSSTSLYVKAQANSAANCEVIGIVSSVATVNVFTILHCGFISGLSNLTPGSQYYLSDSTAGLLTATAPTGFSSIVKPLLIAVSATTGYFFNMVGIPVSAQNSYTTSFANSDLSSGILQVNHNFGELYCAVSVIDNTGKIVTPDEVTFLTTSYLTVDLSSYGTITGNWAVLLLSQGASLGIIPSKIQDATMQTSVEATSDYLVFKVGGVEVWRISGTVNTALTGEIKAYPASTVPTGYLECDGSSYSRTTYAALFAIIGTQYGYVDANHFNVPDYRGYFLRGWDHGVGRDPDAASRTDRGDGTTGDNVGTKETDQFKAHYHGPDSGWTCLWGNNGTNGQGGQYGSVPSSGYIQQMSHTGSTGGNETRPINVNVMWLIKY